MKLFSIYEGGLYFHKMEIQLNHKRIIRNSKSARNKNGTFDPQLALEAFEDIVKNARYVSSEFHTNHNRHFFVIE